MAHGKGLNECDFYPPSSSPVTTSLCLGLLFCSEFAVGCVSTRCPPCPRLVYTMLPLAGLFHYPEPTGLPCSWGLNLSPPWGALCHNLRAMVPQPCPKALLFMYQYRPWVYIQALAGELGFRHSEEIAASLGSSPSQDLLSPQISVLSLL